MHFPSYYIYVQFTAFIVRNYADYLRDFEKGHLLPMHWLFLSEKHNKNLIIR